MKEIAYLKGDATKLEGFCTMEKPAMVIHVCNDIGAWGAGFVLALSKKWKKAEMQYRTMSERILGEVQFVQVETFVVVANMIGQEGTGFKNGVPPIRWQAVNSCLDKVSYYILNERPSLDFTVHCPRFGCGLAGGRWAEVEPFVISNLSAKDIQVYVYDF